MAKMLALSGDGLRPVPLSIPDPSRTLERPPGASRVGLSASQLRSRDATLSRQSANPRKRTGHPSLPVGLRCARLAARWRASPDARLSLWSISTTFMVEYNHDARLPF